MSFFVLSFMPLMILLGLLAMMFINRDVKIPASKLFAAGIVITVLLTVTSTVNEHTGIAGLTPEEAQRIIRLHTVTSTLSYVLRPCLILLEILIILDDTPYRGLKYKLICAIPAIVNGAIFSTALFGSGIAFRITSNNTWSGGPLRMSIFISQIVYLILLLCLSVYSFRENNRRKSAVVIVMCVQAVLAAVLEYEGVEPSYSDAITALCILEYYIYLSTVYRQGLIDRLDDSVAELEAAGEKLETLTEQVIEAFAASIDAKDRYTRGHSARVAGYSRKLAEMNGKDEQECREVYYAALLHDIGKIGIPENIITKDGRLTDSEYAVIRQHPVLGAQILGRIQAVPYLITGARSHHERYDGTGYPDGLKGTDIPEIARIIAVADAYDAMSSRRSYRDAIPQEKVREEIVGGMGTQFDPGYARLMLRLIDEDPGYLMREREEEPESGGENAPAAGAHGAAAP